MVFVASVLKLLPRLTFLIFGLLKAGRSLVALIFLDASGASRDYTAEDALQKYNDTTVRKKK